MFAQLVSVVAYFALGQLNFALSARATTSSGANAASIQRRLSFARLQDSQLICFCVCTFATGCPVRIISPLLTGKLPSLGGVRTGSRIARCLSAEVGAVDRGKPRLDQFSGSLGAGNKLLLQLPLLIKQLSGGGGASEQTNSDQRERERARKKEGRLLGEIDGRQVAVARASLGSAPPLHTCSWTCSKR